MTITVSKSLTLKEFLKLPETKPINEYINGKIIQKPMPKGRHSRLQGKLCAVINQVTEESKIAYAFPELRCSFGQRSIVPDVVIFQWDHICFNKNGEIEDDFRLAPDWTIEILSPEQNPNKVIGNILYFLEFGSKLGWFIDPDDQSILIFLPDKLPILLRENQRLLMLENILLELTANQVFSWLKMN
jgi:Uma2 family endonuclease